MTRLIKTSTEWEGMVHDQYSVIEDQAPPPYPPHADLKVVGKEQSRIDGPERVTGRATYTCDVHLPGMLFARVLRSPFPHARIKKLDTSRAEKLLGVRALLTYQNAPPTSWMNSDKILEPIVKYAGDEVAVVAADDDYIARDALGLIQVEYTELPLSWTPKPPSGPGHPGFIRKEIYMAGNPGSMNVAMSSRVSLKPMSLLKRLSALSPPCTTAWSPTALSLPGMEMR